jgi:glycosyltransferase involved in cell wall biosynthesis
MKFNIAYVVNHAAFFVSHRLPIALEAQRRGHGVRLMTGRAGSESMEPAAEQALRAHAIPHVRVGFTSAGINPLVEVSGLAALVRLMRRARPDLVHCASPKGILYGAIAARLAGTPALVLAVSGMGFAFTTTAESNALRSAIGAIYRLLVHLAYGHPNKRVIVQNQDDRNQLIDAGLAKAAEIVLIPGSGVNLQDLGRTPVHAKEQLVLFPARMIVDKGVLDFIEAARLVRKTRPQWRFVMAGAADYRNPANVPREVLEQSQREGVIEWLGHVADMAPWYEQASIVCLPSYYREGLPKALLEAAACHCAVVTADTTGCREAILPGLTGDLVPPRDPEKLAAVLLALIDDRARRESYGLAGRKLAADRFGIEAVVNRTMDLYGELLSNGGRKQRA